MSDPKLPASPPSPRIVHLWVTAGIVSAAGRFIPIPFVDDVVREQCRRFVVSRTLSAYDRGQLLNDFEPYYTMQGGMLTGCLGTMIKAPLKLLLFPIRKIATIITSIRGVPLEIMRVVLLGRTLDRYLRQHQATSSMPPATLMRSAFDNAFAGMDFRAVRAASAAALASVGGWRKAAMATARQFASQTASSNIVVTVDENTLSGADRVQQVLDRPETLDLFAEFDRRFDAALVRIVKPSVPAAPSTGR